MDTHPNTNSVDIARLRFRVGRGVKLLITAGALGLTACQVKPVEAPLTAAATETRVVVETVMVSPPTNTPRPAFTTPHPVLGDVRVRQGIAHCTNRAEIITSVYPWLDDPARLEMDSFIPPEHWAYARDEASFVRYPFDPQQGQALFEEAGWILAEGATYRTNAAQGEEMALKLTTTNALFRQTWAAVFEEQMKACGLRVLRLHVPAEWWFGETTGLTRRDFELGAFAWVGAVDPGGRTWYACDQIPGPGNDWQGQNYMGWCNDAADQAIQAATNSVMQAEREDAYRLAQAEFSRDLPSLPLFRRVEVSAVNPALENFRLPTSLAAGVYTWNAAEWVIPSQATLVIGEGSEPASLFTLAENAYVTQVLYALIGGVDYTVRDYAYQPVMLKQLPTIENGGAVNTTVEVKAGDSVVDAHGEVVELAPGVVIRNAAGNEVEFAGGVARMKQLVVTYEFVDGLTWSDGALVSREDYELTYTVGCDPAMKDWFTPMPFNCERMAQVDFISDTGYVITWKPGYQEPLYYLPPIGRQPAHLILSDGRRLADVPANEWVSLDEVSRAPLGVGPYVLKLWENGREMVFEANPFYYAGPPATPKIVVKFVERSQAVSALATGAVDVLGWDTVFPDDAPALLELLAAGKAQVFLTPSETWEHVDFALFVK